jgi:hypothetical protein
MATGTKVADVFVDIGFDLSNYQKGLAQAKTEGQSLGAQIKQALNDPAGFSGKSPIAGLVADLQMGRGLVPSLQTAVKGLGGELKSALSAAPGKVFASGLGVAKTALNDLKNIAGQVGKGLLLGLGVGAGLGIAELISKAVQAIPDLINKGQAYAEVVHTIGITSGGSAENISKLTGVMVELGVPISDLTNRLGRLAVSVQSHEAELNALGIATRDSNKVMLSSTQLVENMRAVFSTLPAGIAKARLEVLGFGRGALGTMADYLTLTDPQLQAFAVHAQAAGLIISDSAANEAEAVQRAQGNIGAAVTGLANTIFATVGPTIVSVFDGIAATITSHAQDIANVIQNVIGWVSGLVAGLTGIDLGGSSFTTQVMSMGGASATTSFKLGDLNAQLAALDAKSKTATTSTGAQTSASTALSKAIDAQITKLKALDTAQGKTYKTGLDALNAQLDAQTKLIDAQDQAVQRAATTANLQRSLRDANDALLKTQLDAQAAQAKAASDPTLSAQARAQAQIDAADSVRNAEEAVAQARQAIADNARTTVEEDRKAQIQGVKDYITAIDKLVTDSTGSKTTLAELASKQKALQAGGPAAAGSDRAIELQAVLAAEKRVRDQAANASKTSALQARKDELAQETAAVKSAAATNTATVRAELVKQIAAEKVNIAATAAAQDAAWIVTQGKGQAVFGEGGTLPAAFSTSKQAGIDAANGIRDAFVGKDGNGGLLGAVKSVAAALTGIHIDAGALTMVGLGLVAAGTASLNPVWIAGGLGLIATGSAVGPTDNKLPGIKGLPMTPDVGYGPNRDKNGKWIGPTLQAPPGGGRAAGGYMPPGGTYGINEGTPFEGLFSPKYPNVVVPAPAMPAFASGGGSFGGEPVVIRLPAPWTSTGFIDYIDQKLAYRRHR